MGTIDLSFIADRLKNMKFAKSFFGGVNEEDVWRQINLLNKDYEAAYAAQADFYERQLGAKDAEIEQLRTALAQNGIRQSESPQAARLERFASEQPESLREDQSAPRDVWPPPNKGGGAHARW